MLALPYDISCRVLYFTGRKYEPAPRVKGYSLLLLPLMLHDLWQGM